MSDAVVGLNASNTFMEQAGSEVKVKERVLDPQERAYATGRRKESVARLWLKPGSGKVMVNGKELRDYLKRDTLCTQFHRPMVISATSGSYDVMATVKGGGLSGQAGALAHALSRALDIMCPDLHLILRRGGFLTRDSRVVERKKYGQHKARKKCQFSKR